MIFNTKDRYIRFPLIFITTFIPVILNREGFWEEIVGLQWRFYSDFFMALLTVYLIWELNNGFNILLNKKLPIEEVLLKRLTIQFSVSMVFSVSFIYFIYFFYTSWVVHIPLLDMIPPIADMLVIIIVVLLINIYYTGFNFFMHWKHLEISHEKSSTSDHLETKVNPILVQSGATTLPVYVKEIAAIFIERKHTFLLTVNGKDFLLPESMSFYENKLPDDSFFRLNRQFLVHRESIISYKNSDYGKLEVQIRIGKGNVMVSQKTAATFKTWFKGME